MIQRLAGSIGKLETELTGGIEFRLVLIERGRVLPDLLDGVRADGAILVSREGKLGADILIGSIDRSSGQEYELLPIPAEGLDDPP